MAHNVEPMDVDCIDSDFDNKENSFRHSNVLPCTEKGYEELDVSELNMKLRYSITPASSPMSKSYTACLDNRNVDPDDTLNYTNDNLTRSLNSTITKNDSVIKTLKLLPLQAISAEKIVDSNRNSSVLRQLDTIVTETNNVTVTISPTNDIDENLSLPSSSSSALHTPEATTPVNDLKADGGSPIMRGLKTVFNMFRPSQSPIPADGDNNNKQELATPEVERTENNKHQANASTPIAAHRSKDANTSRRSSPLKESVVFNEDLEKELHWKDETTILFSEEKIPIHKLFFQNKPASSGDAKTAASTEVAKKLNDTVEFMDISCNDSIVKDNTLPDLNQDGKDGHAGPESDNEFVDCETTFTNNESQVLDDGEHNENKDPLIGVETPMLNLTQNDENISVKELVIEADIKSQPQESVVQETNIVKTDELITNSKVMEAETPILNLTQNVENLSVVLEADIKSQPQESIDEMNIVKNDDIITNDTLSNVILEAQDEADSTISIINELDELIEDKKSPVKEETFEISVNKSKTDQSILEQIKQEKDVKNVTFELNPEEKEIKIENEINIEIASAALIENKPDSENATLLDVNDSNQDKENSRLELIDDSKDKVPIIENVETECKEDTNAKVETVNDVLKTEPFVPTEELQTPVADNVPEIEIKIEEKPIEILSDINIPLESLDVIPDEIKTAEPEIPIESPANIPLPDEDEIEKENKIMNTDLNSEVVVIAEPDIIENIIVEEHADNSTVVTSVDIAPSDSNKTVIIENENPIPPVQDIIKTDSNKTVIIEKDTVPPMQDFSTTEIDLGEEVQESVTNTEPTTHDVTMTFNDDVINKTQEIETMDVDISMSEIHSLPDLVNQTTVKAIDIPQVTQEINTDNVLHTDNDLTATNIENREFPELVPPVTVELETKSSEQIDIAHSGSDITDNSNLDIMNVNSDEVIQINEVNSNSTFVIDLKLSSITVDLERVPPGMSRNEDVESNAIDMVEEIVLSENNSPYVSLMAGIDTEAKIMDENFEEIDNTFIPINTAPSSPPIVSRGYNFNFDEMDDPFATKTKIRMSPPPNTPAKVSETEIDSKKTNSESNFANRRKSQPPERKRPGVMNKKKFNSTFDSKHSKGDKKVNKIEEKPVTDTKHDVSSTVEANNATIDINKTITGDIVPDVLDIQVAKKANADISPEIEDKVAEQEYLENEPIKFEKHVDLHIESKSSDSSVNEIKPTSSSEQSTYYSAATSSTDSSIRSKNVFNLPEIDDMNFNPFATKSKIRKSPTRDFDMDNPFATKSKLNSSPDSSIILPRLEKVLETKPISQATVPNNIMNDKMDTELMEKETPVNTSFATTSSKTTDDKNLTQEINTEDDDTEEGPFLDIDDANVSAGNDDMMQFNEIPPRVENDDGELFIDAEAFEFLLNQNQSNVVTDSGKESLFLKFDPLFAKRLSSTGVFAALSKIQNKVQPSPTKIISPLNNEVPSAAGPSNMNVTFDGDNINFSQESIDDLNVTVSKPTMIVTPAVNQGVTPRNKSITPNRINRRSITSSPAMAVIDRLLSLSANNSPVPHDINAAARREQNEAELALVQLRELLAEKEIQVYNLRSESKELKERLTTMESLVRTLETDGQNRLKRINDLTNDLAEKSKINKSMAAVVEEYERTIASLIAGIEQDKKNHAEERIRLINERNEQTAHLSSMEVSFSDLHSKYEKSKQIILSCKANEETYKKSLKEFEESVTKMQKNYEMLKQHASTKLNQANQEFEKLNKAHESEVLKFNAMIKRKDLHITSLEESLAQKIKANDELTAICDELINKVG